MLRHIVDHNWQKHYDDAYSTQYFLTNFKSYITTANLTFAATSNVMYQYENLFLSQEGGRANYLIDGQAPS